jgi:hypothetical protein
VLVLASETAQAVICDLDLALVSNSVDLSIRRAVGEATHTPLEAVRLSMSHTHAGPEVWSTYLADTPVVQSYLDSLVHQVAGAAYAAYRNLTPVTVTAGQGEVSLAINRRQKLAGGRVVVGCNPDGFSDHSVPVVRLDTTEGTPLACIFGYAMHPTILGPPNRLLSPDYPGVARRSVELITGATPLFLQGSAGNQGPGWQGFTDDVTVAERAGQALACEAAKVFLACREERFQPIFDRIWESGAPLGTWTLEPKPADAQLSVINRTVNLPVKPAPLPAEAEAEAATLKDERQALIAAGAPLEEIEAITWRTKRADMRARHARNYSGLQEKAIEVQALRIGPVALVGVPLEPFAEIGVAVKQASPFTVTHVSGYTNGWLGYLPTAASYPEGGYEVDTTPFSAGADSVLIEGIGAMLVELA